MDFVIEDGYNTSYLSAILISLLYEKSMIERCLLLENNSLRMNGIYLQKLIQQNFVEPIRNNINISSHMLNEIRLCASVEGWGDDKPFEEFKPIDFLKFLVKTINFVPMKVANLKNTASNEVCINIQTAKITVQEMYNDWMKCNKITNLPSFVIFEIKNQVNNFQINKKIKLFQPDHQCCNVRWIFHSLFFKNKKNYFVVISKNDTLLSFSQNEFPCIKKLKDDTIHRTKDKDIYIIYRKEPTI